MSQVIQQVQDIAISKIKAGNNDRTIFKQQPLEELANSIREHGLAQPITVRPCGDGYEIVAGERRYRAISTILQWETIPCLVRELSDEEASAIMLVENTARVDLDPIAEAEAYRVRAEKFGWDNAKIASVAGVSAERVRGRMELLKLAYEIQHLVRYQQMPIGHAQLLGDLDINRQRIAMRVFNTSTSMPMSRWRDIVATLYEQQVAESQMSMFDLELKLMEEVSADAVTVRRGKGARTGAPVKRDLPPVRISGKDSTGDVMERYIMDLLASGHEDAAAIIGNVYNALVAGNWVGVPVASALAKASDSDELAGDAPIQEV